jgi:hypothetical protein
MLFDRQVAEHVWHLTRDVGLVAWATLMLAPGDVDGIMLQHPSLQLHMLIVVVMV